MKQKHNTQTEDGKPKDLSRRTALGMIGGTLGALVVAGCGGGSSTSASGTTSTATGTTTGTTTTAHAVTPEGEIGPYFTDDSAAAYNRSDIRANIDGSSVQTGIPLMLKVNVYDSEASSAAYTGAQVDIWHCNALGVYSNEASEGTSGQTWLRGYQVTDSGGLVTFQTILPGWYQGRTTHIHFRVRSKYSQASSTGDGSNTTQLFFPQDTLNTIYTTVAPYNTKGTDTTTNASDRVYTQQTHGENETPLVGSAAGGYTASFAIYLPITSE